MSEYSRLLSTLLPNTLSLRPRTKNLLIFGVILGLCALRFIHLGADTPIGVSNNIGLYVDEGYKTLDPRNLVLFGSEKWHPDDDYPGWIKNSPLTQWPYYFAFQTFGVNIESARLVTILSFFILLCGYAYTMANRYSAKLLFVGLCVLGLQNTIFFFSRVALFEVPIITFVYLILFLFIKIEHSPLVAKLAVLLLGAILSVCCIKASAMIYLFPVIITTILASAFKCTFFQKKITFCWVSLSFICLILLLAIFFYDRYESRISFSFIIKRVLIYRAIDSAPCIVIMGLFCACQGLLSRPKAYLNDNYSAGLLGIVVLCPILLAFFSYNPLRYYVPILPAYILLFLEWFHQKTWNHTVAKRLSPLYSTAIFIILIPLVFYIAHSLNKHILTLLPVKIGDEPGISDSSMLELLTPVAVFLSALIYCTRRYIFSTNIIVASCILMFVLCFFYNATLLSRFFLYPSYQSQNIQTEIENIVPPEAIIAGDWAPFFLLSTKIKSLYMNTKFNRDTIMSIRPNYLLYSDNRNSFLNMQAISELNDVTLGTPLYESYYNAKGVILYPIIYNK